MTDRPGAGLTYAVPDLHGRFDLLQSALAAIDAHAAPETGTIVFLGDYVDRGPGSAQVLERLIEGPPPAWHWICLKGNHEAMMALALRNPDRMEWWLGNGGDATIRSYRDYRPAVARHLEWIDCLQALHIDTHRVYVHAGVEAAMPLDAQAEKVLLWKRYPSSLNEGHGPRHVVHGHDPNPDGPLRLTNRTGLDTLAWRTGRLAIGVFDDERAGGPIDVLAITGDAVSG